MTVPTTLADLNTTASLNSPAGTDNVGTTMDEFLRAIQAIIKAEAAAGADITAASTITPPAAGSFFIVTGNTGITTIASTYSWNGRKIWLKFSGTPILTNSGTLILKGGANITAAAGDVFGFEQDSAGTWRMFSYYTIAAAAAIATNLAGGSGGTIPYQSAAATTAMLANGTAGQLLMANGTTVAPSWTSTLNLDYAVGGTWTAAATWTLPAFTLGGAVTGNSQNISGLGTIGSGAISSTGALSVFVAGAGRTAGQITMSGTGSKDITFGQLSSTGGDQSIITFQDRSGAVQLQTNPTTDVTTIGSGNPTVTALAGTGSRTVLASSTGVLSAPVSDASAKENMIPLAKQYDVMAMLSNDSIRGISFDMLSDGDHQVGFTTQMFKDVKGLTGTMTASGTGYLNYDRIPAILWEQNRQMYALIQKLQEQLDEKDTKQ